MNAVALRLAVLDARRPAPPDNLGRTVHFRMDGEPFTRRLVAGSNGGDAQNLSTASPVGKVLLRACPGDRLTVDTPGGPVAVELLEVAE